MGMTASLNNSTWAAAKNYTPKSCCGYGSRGSKKPFTSKMLGGKGYHLQQLVLLETPVPPFIVIPTTVYRKVINHPMLNPLTQKSTSLISLNDLDKIRKLILEQVKFPSTIISEIEGFLHLLPHRSTVSCRSSANCEDSIEVSFAGQFSTYLHLRNLNEVVQGLKKCYCSVWEKSVLDYRESMKLTQQIEMAVVIQLQIDSEVSGVASTCNPMNNMTNECVIEAVYGQGEGMVSGEITPDKYIVNQDTDEVHLFSPALKNECYQLASSTADSTNGNSGNSNCKNRDIGVEKVEVLPLQKKYAPCLNAAQMVEISNYGKKIKKYYKCPVDIEYAVDAATKKILLLQVRPVTTTSMNTGPVGNPTLKWFYNLDQYEKRPSKTFLELNKQWLRPLTPIYQQYVKSLNGASGGFRKIREYIPLLSDPYLAIVNGFVYVKMGKGEAESKLPPSEWLIRLLGGLLFGGANKVIGNVFSNKTYLHQLDEWDETVRPEFDDKHRAFANTDITILSNDELKLYVENCIKHLERSLHNHFKFLSGTLFPPGALVEFCESVTDEVPMKDILAIISQPDNMFNHSPGKVLQEAVKNGYKTDTSETFLKSFLADLYNVQQKVMNNDTSDPASNEKLNNECLNFFEKYCAKRNTIGRALKDWFDLTGYRLLGQYDMTTITAIEAPTIMIADLVACIEYEANHERENKRKEASKLVRKKLPQNDDVLNKFDLLLADALHCDRFRGERSLHGLLSAGGHCRRALLEVGKRYFKSNPATVKSFHVSDILYITESELKHVFEQKGNVTINAPLLRRLVKRRTYSLAYTVTDAPAYINGPPYPKLETAINKTSLPTDVAKGLRALSVSTRMVGLDGVNNHHAPGETELSGNPASDGEIIGRAKVIKHPNQISTIRKGDLVIIAFTNSSFNAVMSLVAGIVTESGGTLSHAGVIAREMGIPCVTDVINAVNVVPNGSKVKLDGTHGKLYIL